MLRVVLDTNVFVSSLLVKTGQLAQVIDAWRERQYLLLVSPPIMAEIANTLSYPRNRRKYGITDRDVRDLLDLLEHEALVVPGIADASGAIPDDPDDESVLACAVDGEADIIVSGDQHLLTLQTYEGIRILTVRAFIDTLDAPR